MYTRVMIYMKHSSCLVLIVNQVSMVVSDKVQGKQDFQIFSASCGVSEK